MKRRRVSENADCRNVNSENVLKTTNEIRKGMI